MVDLHFFPAPCRGEATVFRKNSKLKQHRIEQKSKLSPQSLKVASQRIIIARYSSSVAIKPFAPKSFPSIPKLSITNHEEKFSI